MKTESKSSRPVLAGSVTAVMVLAISTLFAQGPPTKTVEFKTGKFEAKLADSVCSADLDTPGSDLDFFASGVQVFGAHYSAKDCQIRFSLLNVKGPGKYGKANIFNLSINYGPTQKAWNFNGRQNDCTFTFTKLDQGGAQGSVACTSAGPLTTATFSAAP